MIKTLLLLPLAILYGQETKKYVGYNPENLVKLDPTVSLDHGDQYGHAVAIWGRVALVSAAKRFVATVGEVADDGVVYAFSKNEYDVWEYHESLVSSIGDDGFGESLALVDGTAIIGACRDSTYGIFSGRVEIYISNSDLFATKETLYASTPSELDYFGFSVAIIKGSGYFPHGSLVIGAYGHDNDHRITNSGSVFVFAHTSTTGWEIVSILAPSQPAVDGNFGWSVAAHSNAIIVGAPGQDSAFVFHFEGISTECPHDGRPEDMPEGCNEHFRKLQIGGHHVYTKWAYLEILHVIDGNDGNQFGTSVAISNTTLLSIAVGGPRDSSETGSVTIMSRLNNDDVWSSFEPEHHQQNLDPMVASSDTSSSTGTTAEERLSHPSPILPRRRLQDKEHEDHEDHEDHENDHRSNIWIVNNYEFSTDKDGNYWMKEVQLLGDASNEMFGSHIDIYESELIVGTLPGYMGMGRVGIFKRNQTTVADQTSPVYRGPLFMTRWVKVASFNGVTPSIGDYFGSSVAIYDGDIVVGGYLEGGTADYVGTGGAYVMSSYTLATSSDGSTNLNENDAAGGTPIATFSLVIAVLLAVAVLAVATVVHQNCNRSSSKSDDYGTSGLSGIDMSISSATSSHPLNVVPTHHVNYPSQYEMPPRYEYDARPVNSVVATHYVNRSQQEPRDGSEYDSNRMQQQTNAPPRQFQHQQQQQQQHQHQQPTRASLPNQYPPSSSRGYHVPVPNVRGGPQGFVSGQRARQQRGGEMLPPPLPPSLPPPLPPSQVSGRADNTSPINNPNDDQEEKGPVRQQSSQSSRSLRGQPPRTFRY